MGATRPVSRRMRCGSSCCLLEPKRREPAYSFPILAHCWRRQSENRSAVSRSKLQVLYITTAPPEYRFPAVVLDSIHLRTVSLTKANAVRDKAQGTTDDVI